MIYSIGHGRKTPQQFVAELLAWGIRTVIDVRSIPYSHVAPQFDQNHIASWLADAGIAYQWRGNDLGGYPGRDDYLDAQGNYSYQLIAGRKEFGDALSELAQMADDGPNLALMCAEQAPDHCHRALLLGRELWQRHDINLCHIIDTTACISQTALFERLTHGHWHPNDHTILGDNPMPIIWPKRHPHHH